MKNAHDGKHGDGQEANSQTKKDANLRRAFVLDAKSVGGGRRAASHGCRRKEKIEMRAKQEKRNAWCLSDHRAFPAARGWRCIQLLLRCWHGLCVVDLLLLRVHEHLLLVHGRSAEAARS